MIAPPVSIGDLYGTALAFHHIGIAANDIQETAKFYIKIGYRVGRTIFDVKQNVYIAFLDNRDMPRIELLEPGPGNSPVTKILEKSGVTPYHLCYTVDNIDQAVGSLRKEQFVPLSRPVEAAALGNRRICFLYNKSAGLIELLEA